MGWIHQSSPAAQLHKVAGQIEVERTRNGRQTDSKPTQLGETKKEDTRSYPIQPKKTADKDLPFIPASEVQKQNGKDGNKLLIAIDDIVLDCTDYISRHPGGRQIVQGFAGQNCGWQWWSFHSRTVWNNIAVNLRVGRTEGIENKFVKPPGFVGLRPFGYQDD